MNIAKRKDYSDTEKDTNKLSNRETFRVLNAVIYWYSIRILMAVLLNVVTALSTGIISNLHMTVIPTLNFFICVLMSLLLTYCKDIISYLTHIQNSK